MRVWSVKAIIVQENLQNVKIHLGQIISAPLKRLNGVVVSKKLIKNTLRKKDG